MEYQQKYLLANWHASGKDPSEFHELVDMMTNATRLIKVGPDEVRPWFYVEYEDPRSHDRFAAIVPVIRNPYEDPMGYGVPIAPEVLTGPGNDWDCMCKEVYDEFTSRNLTMLQVNRFGEPEEHIIMDRSWLSDLSLVRFNGVQAPAWEELVTAYKRICQIDLTFVARVAHENGKPVQKIFAMRSGKYPNFPQNEGLKIIDKVFDDGEMSNYYIDNFETCAEYTFPELTQQFQGNKIVPGVRWTTSNVGTSAWKCVMFYDINGHRIFLCQNERAGSGKITTGLTKVSRKHCGQWSAELAEDLEKQLYELRNKFQILPNRMRDLACEKVLKKDIAVVIDNLCVDSGLGDINKANAQAYQQLVVGRLNLLRDNDGKMPKYIDAATIVTTMIEVASEDSVRLNLNRDAALAFRLALGEIPFCRIKRKVGSKIEQTKKEAVA